MTKYYMSLNTLVEVDGETESVRFAQAKQKFLDLLNKGDVIEIELVDVDDSEDE
jgi:hypothetical protein